MMLDWERDETGFGLRITATYRLLRELLELRKALATLVNDPDVSTISVTPENSFACFIGYTTFEWSQGNSVEDAIHQLAAKLIAKQAVSAVGGAGDGAEV